MLNVGTLTQNQSTDIFNNSDSIKLLPVVSAEWNHNLFNPPYITTAGTGTKISGTVTSGTIYDANNGKENFTTKALELTNGNGSVSYTVSGLSGSAYKVITYVKTNSATPIMVNAFGKGSDSQFGSEQVEASSLGWTKIITYVGASKNSDTFSSFVYKIVANSFSETTYDDAIDADDAIILMFTVPEIYETTYFDYKYGSLWPTESPFTYFRPGESYVGSGDIKCSFVSNYRRIASKVLNSETLSGGFYGNKYMPVSPIIQNPSFFLSSPPVAVLKNALPTDTSSYQYFVSDYSSKSISAVYEKNIVTNKIVIKCNTIMTTPTFSMYLDDSALPSLAGITPNSSGVVVLYYTGSAWTQDKWVDMPKFDANGVLATKTTFKKIRLTQTSRVINSAFSSYSGDSVTNDLNRMQIVEISPRLEINLSDFVQSVDIDKSLDADNTSLPISSINSNDARIVLSGIPIVKNDGSFVPIFSSQSNSAATILSNMMRKNVKFYVNFNLVDHAVLGSAPTLNVNTYIPGGVFYSDSWEENDISDVTIQSFDISRYLQSKPVPDYVANLKTVFEVITNILDLAGFTDYDYDSLYKICNNKANPLDIAYYYCNSKDSTVIDALNQIFVAYQIGAYIDEYGVMRFLSLHKMLTDTASVLTIEDQDIVEGGISVSNLQKPGKISLRYQTPKVKQSPALQNVENLDIKNSPSAIYTTSNDVVWEQQTTDSVGFNYLYSNMSEESNTMTINNNDLLDIFHTFNLDNSGYAAIENEIVSFEYKQYTISAVNGSNPVNVSVKNNLELSSEVNKYIKEYTVGLKTSDGTSKQGYDVKIIPTGKITNVQRGMFGTVPTAHNRVTTLASKGLIEKTINSSFNFSSTTGHIFITNNKDSSSSLPDVTKIGIGVSGTNKIAVCPAIETNNEYKTYSVKFDLPDQYVVAAGMFLNQTSSGSSTPLFIELIKYSTTNPQTGFFYEPPQYKYILAIYDSSSTVYAWADVTGQCNSVLNNLPKILTKTLNGSTYAYSYIVDKAFNLKVVINSSNGSDGENATENFHKAVLYVSLNNSEITGWQIPKTSTTWEPPKINTLTGARQKPVVPDMFGSSKSFGFYASPSPVVIPGTSNEISYPTPNYMLSVANLREIHATEKPLFEKSVNYFYQDREFLNGLVQKQPLHSNSLTYIMQTTPSISGINYYDVQYDTPAAVSVDVFPVEYMLTYFPGSSKQDQQNKQKKLVTEYSLSYSTPINTGFRARMAIANNSPHMVLLTKEPDEIQRVKVTLNLWTHEIVGPSSPEIIESVIDSSNASEVVQLDSEWIQSKTAAHKLLKIVEMGIEGFSKTVTVNMFGNPLIQVGDVITLSYTLKGMLAKKYIVTSVSQSFSQGLSTSLTLKRLY